MRGVRWSAILLALAMSCSSAMAMQTATTDVRLLSRDAGVCLAEKRPEVAEVILHTPRTVDERAQLEVLAVDGDVASCISERGKPLNLTILRGSIAEARYRQAFPTALDARAIATTEPVIPGADDSTIMLRYWFAQCLVSSAAAGADMLVRSVPGAPEESAGIAAITPAFTGCLPKDMTAKFTRPELRALVSEALYRAATTLRDREACRQLSFEEAVRDKRTCPPISIPNTNVVRPDDYPEASLRAGEVGETTVQFSVGVDGKVEAGSCVVTRSSGYERLDRNTCAIASERFRFRPALLRGKPVAQVRNHSTRYYLPDGP